MRTHTRNPRGARPTSVKISLTVLVGGLLLSAAVTLGRVDRSSGVDQQTLRIGVLPPVSGERAQSVSTSVAAPGNEYPMPTLGTSPRSPGYTADPDSVRPTAGVAAQNKSGELVVVAAPAVTLPPTTAVKPGSTPSTAAPASTLPKPAAPVTTVPVTTVPVPATAPDPWVSHGCSFADTVARGQALLARAGIASPVFMPGTHSWYRTWDGQVWLAPCASDAVVAHELGHWVMDLAHGRNFDAHLADAASTFCPGGLTADGKTCAASWFSSPETYPGVEHAAHCVGWALFGDSSYTRCRDAGMQDAARARVSAAA